MEGSIKPSALRLKKPEERKTIEKNRRNQMKCLYSHLFSLIPHTFISKGGDQVLERMDRAIEYIKSLKTNLELSNNMKEKLLSRKRSHDQQLNINNVCKSVDIQIHEMSHDLDAVLVTGLTNHSSFCDVVKLLSQYSTEVALANFSSSGHSTFHIRHKKIEAKDIYKRLKILLEGSSNTKEFGDNASFCINKEDSNTSIWDFEGSSNVKELGDNASFSINKVDWNLSTIWDFEGSSNVKELGDNASFCNNQVDLSTSIWDFDFQLNIWEWELETVPMSVTI